MPKIDIDSSQMVILKSKYRGAHPPPPLSTKYIFSLKLIMGGLYPNVYIYILQYINIDI